MEDLIIHLTLARTIIFTLTKALIFEFLFFNTLLAVTLRFISGLKGDGSTVTYLNKNSIVLFQYFIDI